jgi:hypothetical protein
LQEPKRKELLANREDVGPPIEADKIALATLAVAASFAVALSIFGYRAIDFYAPGTLLAAIMDLSQSGAD